MAYCSYCGSCIEKEQLYCYKCGRVNTARRKEIILNRKPISTLLLAILATLLAAVTLAVTVTVTVLFNMAVHPDAVSPGITVAEFCMAIERPDKALKVADWMISAEPEKGDGYQLKGDILHETGEYRDAIDSYDKGLEINPENVTVWIERGVCYYYLGLYNQAVSDYQTALEIDPENTDALRNIALVYRMQNNPEKEMEYYDRALRINNSENRILLDKASYYYSLEDYENSARFAKKAIEAGNMTYDAHVLLAHSLYMLEKYEDAVMEYTIAIMLTKKNIDCELYFFRGICYMKTEEYDSAIEDFQRCIDNNYEVSGCYQNLNYINHCRYLERVS